MVYLPPSQSTYGSPGPTSFPPGGGSVLNSPMFQGYEGGAPIPSYAAPSAIPSTPAASGLMDQINLVHGPTNYESFMNPAVSPTVENAIASTAPEAARIGILGSLRGALTRNFAQDSPAITGEEATGLLAKTPYSLAPLAMTVAGGYLQGHTQPGSQPYSVGKGLSLGGGLSGGGLLGSSVLAGAGAIPGTAVLPIAAGLALGGLGGGYLNSQLAAHDVNLGPFHWGGSGHAESQFHDQNVDHLIGTAMDQFKAGNISNGDFVTIVKNAQLQQQLGANPKDIASSLQSNIVQAAQLNQQREAQQRQQVADNHRMLREQLAIAKLMQPDLQDINQSAQGLQSQIASAHLTGPMAQWAQLLGQQTVNQGKRQTAAITQSELALPQIQALMAQIQAQNTAQQAANYYAARQSSGTGGSSLSSLLNQTQTPAVTGASPTGG